MYLSAKIKKIEEEKRKAEEEEERKKQEQEELERNQEEQQVIEEECIDNEMTINPVSVCVQAVFECSLCRHFSLSIAVCTSRKRVRSLLHQA